MAASNPSVSVFHFTQRVSSAKIRKYKLATERGMGGGVSATSTAALDASPALDPSTMERPAKKPRLKLNVRPPVDNRDTIAVSRPRSPLQIRYSENMIIDVDKAPAEQKRKQSPAASSDLSSLTSLNSVEKAPTPPRTAVPAPSKPRDYGRDFMSYYVADGDGDDTEDEVVEVPPPNSKSAAPQQAAATTAPNQPQRQVYTPQHVQPLAQPAASMQPPPPQLPQPTVSLIDTTPKLPKPEIPDTVAVMIQKIESLSQALTFFIGVSDTPQSPLPEPLRDCLPQPPSEAVPNPVPDIQAGEEKDVDNFLAMFDDDDESEEKDDASEKTSDKRAVKAMLDYRLDNQGQLDVALTHGIHFIQNALRSWAHQRLSSQYTQYYMSYHHQAAQAQNRGPGRPRRFEDEQTTGKPPPINIQFDLAKTPEGEAIKAFQDVLDCGCLLVNHYTLPRAMTRSMRKMYRQVHRLINRGEEPDVEWQCMSYGAQIEAQKVRVEKWQEAQARAQIEMARQQQMAHQQMIQSMGMRHTYAPQMSAEEAQKQHAIDLERKRSLQHAAQQPHLTKYLTNPLKLDVKSTLPKPTTTKLIPIQQPPAHYHTANHIMPNTNMMPTQIPNQANIPPDHPFNDPNVSALEKLRMIPTLFSRSGQSMKFSFAPTSDLALKAFGAQAFPAPQTGGNLPNRGPMSANPHFINSHAHQVANGPSSG